MHSPQSLPFLSVLRCTGPDAEAFLQGQVTQDVPLLRDGRTLLAACCTPQGRALALAWLRRSGDAIYALLPGELADALLVHLRRFVLRSKVALERAEGRLLVATVDARSTPGPRAPADAVEFRLTERRRVLLLPPGPGGLEVPAASLDDWRLADIRDGIPELLAATSGAFVPQMLNLDCLGGISFAKGCYTGQEIVARTQFLGRIKRRTLRFALAGGPVPQPGERLLDGDSGAGEVLVAAATPEGAEMLAVVSLEQSDRPLRLATRPDRALEQQPLPYSLQPVDPASGRM